MAAPVSNVDLSNPFENKWIIQKISDDIYSEQVKKDL